MKRLAGLWIFGLIMFVSLVAVAADVPSNQVSFGVSASEEVDSDLLVVRLFIQHEDKQQARASARVNEDMAWALGLSKKVSAVKVQTLDYQTNPIYDERRIKAWQTRQTLRLESADSDALTTLLGTLQERLGIESVGYQLSPAVRGTVEQRLIDEAIKRFAQRAAEIASAFARAGYSLVNVNISTQGGQRPPPVYRGRAMAMESSVASPSIEAGQQSLTVNINGTIALVPN
jgi:predicted secreted protein